MIPAALRTGMMKLTFGKVCSNINGRHYRQTKADRQPFKPAAGGSRAQIVATDVRRWNRLPTIVRLLTSAATSFHSLLHRQRLGRRAPGFRKDIKAAHHGTKR